MGDAFQIRLDLSAETPVLHMEGEITSDAEQTLLARYEEIPPERRDRIILDFENTRYINSSGIAILIQLITRAGDNGQQIEFSTLSGHFRKVMDIVGLTDFVQIHDTLTDALH